MGKYLSKSQRPTKNKLPLWAALVVDVLLTGIALIVFALFHHVLPSQAEEPAQGIVIQPQSGMFAPAATTQATDTEEPGTDETGASEEAASTEPSETVQTEPAGKFDHLFTDEPIWTENTYSSPTVHVSMSTHATTYNNGIYVTYHVADIYVKDVRCFQSYFAGNKFTKGAYAYDILKLDKESNAIVAINGDYFSYQSGTCVLRNGVLYRYPTADADICVLNYDGTMVTYRGAELTEEADIDAAIANAWQVWSFGPALLQSDGSIYPDLNSYTTLHDAYPRTGIGYFEPGHYCFVVVDGRQRHSVGAQINFFAQIFSDLGCVSAYNLDGGGSSRMTFNDAMYSKPSESRTLPDILLITEYEGSIAQAALEAAEKEEP